MASPTMTQFLSGIEDFLLASKTDEGSDDHYAFRNFLADSHVEHYEKLSEYGEMVELSHKVSLLNSFRMTPQLLRKMSVVMADAGMISPVDAETITIAKALLSRLPDLEVDPGSETMLLAKAVKQFASVLAKTEVEHAFADYFLKSGAGGKSYPWIPVLAYIDENTGGIDYGGEGDDMQPITISKGTQVSISRWVRKNEGTIVVALLNGPLVDRFTATLAKTADEQGFPSIGCVIRARQLYYSPAEILSNARDHGVHPDARMIELLEEKSKGSGIKSIIDSNSSLLAYSLVHHVKTDLLNICPDSRHVVTKALKAIADTDSQPSREVEPLVQAKALDMIADARDYDSVSWMQKISCLKDVLLRSLKFKGMRVESDLGM